MDKRRQGPPTSEESQGLVELSGADEARLLREIVEHIPDMIFVKDAKELRFVRFNRAGEALLGYQRGELLGKNDYDFFPAEEASFFVAKDREVLRGGELVDIPEEPIHTREHGERILHTKKVPILGPDGTPEYLLGISEDITELAHTRQKLEATNQQLIAARLREAQKLELLGVLAGGIAHDFNNMLVGVLGNASLALMELEDSHPARELVANIESAGRQAAALTRQMLAYSGRGKFMVEPVDVSGLVQDVLLLLKASISKTARLSIELGSGTTVEADRTQLQQLIMNLIANASDALGDTPGEISVRVSRVHRSEGMPSDHPWDSGPMEAGDHVIIEVADDGPGMDEATLSRIFEPFYTTKSQGHGLGLAAALGILKSHAGSVRVQSAPGVGTTFTLSFPVTDEARAVRPAPGRNVPRAEVQGRGKRVLVADDETHVLQFVRRALEGQGFEVVATEDGVEALAEFERAPHAFDLVLLDMSMPNMGGQECLQRIRAVRADVPALVSSGFDESESPLIAEPGTEFLQKPYRMGALLDVVSRLLE